MTHVLVVWSTVPCRDITPSKRASEAYVAEVVPTLADHQQVTSAINKVIHNYACEIIPLFRTEVNVNPEVLEVKIPDWEKK